MQLLALGSGSHIALTRDVRHLFITLSLTLALGSACAPDMNAGNGDLCAEASAHLQDCGAKPANFDSTCTDRDAQLMLGLSCDELESGPTGNDKSDVITQPKGDDCWWDWQCSGELVCRPGGGVEGDLCLAKGKYGSLCSADDECADTFECVEDAVHGDRCRQPLN